MSSTLVRVARVSGTVTSAADGLPIFTAVIVTASTTTIADASFLS